MSAKVTGVRVGIFFLEMRLGLFRDEFANFIVKSRNLVTSDTVLLRISLPMLPNSWGEDFIPFEDPKFPKSFCVMVGTRPEAFKPFTPVFIGKEHMDLLVKTYPLGRVSRDLFNVKEGDRLLIRGPREKLEIDRALRGVKRLIAFAGGTGITPIFQVIKHLISCDRMDVEEIILFDANKTRDDILLKEDLEALKLVHSRFRIDHIISAERGHVNLGDMAGIEREEDDFVVVCGPRGFNETLMGNAGIGGILKDKLYKSTQIYKF